MLKCCCKYYIKTIHMKHFACSDSVNQMLSANKGLNLQWISVVFLSCTSGVGVYYPRGRALGPSDSDTSDHKNMYAYMDTCTSVHPNMWIVSQPTWNEPQFPFQVASNSNVSHAIIIHEQRLVQFIYSCLKRLHELPLFPVCVFGICNFHQMLIGVF